MTQNSVLPSRQATDAVLLGRVWNPAVSGPSIVTIRGDDVIDITHCDAPTVRDVCEMTAPIDYVKRATGPSLMSVSELMHNSIESNRDSNRPWLIAPNDLQAIKAAGVTFVKSMLERVIEEQARGDHAEADSVRKNIQSVIGEDIAALKPGSFEAERLKKVLIEKNAWSQYLEVGIGPDPEIFTKSQPMSAVGFGADIGVYSESTWNNPEPEIVLAVSSVGVCVGATLGNDVNLRDIEGRSALLLSKAKDNNASCAIGPLIRLFDEQFTMKDVCAADVSLHISGDDGFELSEVSSMSQISRTPSELINATINASHQYPDGFVLFLGTMFAPTQDRDAPGKGFTHKENDIVTVQNPMLGALRNRVRPAHQCAPWTFGCAKLMRNLASRGLLDVHGQRRTA